MNSKTEPFEPKHVFEMALRPSEIERLGKDPNALARIIALCDIGYGVTLFVDEKIIGVFGYMELWPGVFEVWAFPSIHVERHAVIYLRTVKRCIKAIEATLPVTRLQTTAFADDLHTSWMEFLGFKCETPAGMKNYSVLGQTFNMWAKTYGG